MGPNNIRGAQSRTPAWASYSKQGTATSASSKSKAWSLGTGVGVCLNGHIYIQGLTCLEQMVRHLKFISPFNQLHTRKRDGANFLQWQCDSHFVTVTQSPTVASVSHKS